MVLGDLIEGYRSYRGRLSPRAWFIRESIILWLRAGVDDVPKGPGGRATVSWLDVKLALRVLVKYPGLTLAGGFGIAVSIAIGASAFSIAQSYYYPSIPLSEGDRLVGLQNWDLERNTWNPRSLYDFGIWRQEMKSVEDMAAFRTVSRNVVAADGSVELIEVADITPSGFRQARVPPLLGRPLLEGDASSDATPVIVIGFDMWRARFASDPDIVGRDLRLESTVHTVVGVMPEGFAYPVDHGVWIPLGLDPSDYAPGEGPPVRISGRLAPGFDLADALAELTIIGDRMAGAFPDTHGGFRAQVLPYHLAITGEAPASISWRFGLWISLVTLVLVVVCVNVAILIYARTATRRGEIAVRSALGASRKRIVVQMLAESLVLSGGAAAVGLVIARLGLGQARGIEERFGGVPPFWMDFSLTGTALVYVGALTMLAAVITGVMPALQATIRGLHSDLSQFNSGVGLHLGRTWTILIVLQVAVAVAALPITVATGWFQVRDVFTVPTFPVEEFLFAHMSLEWETPPGGDFDAYDRVSDARFASLQTELSRRLEAEPGVLDHSFMFGLPGWGMPFQVAIADDSTASGAGHQVQWSAADLNFFRLFDIELLSGRHFRSGDEWVLMVSRAFARRFFGDGDALGRRIRIVGQERWGEIVGVVEDHEENPIDGDLVEPFVYQQTEIIGTTEVDLALRVAGVEPAAMAGRLQRIAATIDPGLRLNVTPLEEQYRRRRAALTTVAVAIGIALLVVLPLSAAGIHALMSFTVVRRRREIAIRTALGAEPRRLLGGIFGKALGQISVGVALGVGAALLLDGAFQGQLLQGRAGPLLAATVIVMGVVGLFAALDPARRGLRVEPTEALKGE